MITYKTYAEIEIMKQGGAILAAILKKTAELVRPGASAADLEQFATEKIADAGAKPAFLNYKTKNANPYPNILSVSVNSEVVHALPLIDKIFQQGDVVGLDCGIWYNGLSVDAALTVACGEVDAQSRKLINTTREALQIGVSKCRIDNYLGDMGFAVQKFVESQGFKVIKTLVGHGVGYQVHEDPQVPNFFPFDEKNPKNRGPKLKQGMTLAIEPMVSISAEKTKKGKDGFASITIDGSLSAHFEHTVAVTKNGPLILTLDLGYY
ncbi:MAG: type I methionyl aminopeptidase [Candidatus Jacksonbacteria bacterium]